MKQLKLTSYLLAGALALSACADDSGRLIGPSGDAAPNRQSGPTGINVVLNTAATDPILADLATYGNVTGQITELNAVTLRADASLLATIQALPYVSAASFDQERRASPIVPTAATTMATGRSTWNLDAIDVTNTLYNATTGNLAASGRTMALTGEGVYVGVLDTGLLHTWRQYFPDEKIAEEYARSFVSGPVDGSATPNQPNKWEHDTNSHGTHVTSTILGFNLGGVAINGVAPNAIVIPVKVLNQNGSGWSSAIARGIVYIATLKDGELGGAPVVINMSLGGGALDAVEKAAVDYAVSKGVIIVASAGNSGAEANLAAQRMGYPGAYEPVISVAASGWNNQFTTASGPGPKWTAGSWWHSGNVLEPTNADDFYIADFSSRAFPGQDLDVSAPGYWIVGPYQTSTSTAASFYYLSGTSMASPHVAGIVALMAQKKGSLTPAEAEQILTSTAIPIAPGSRTVKDISQVTVTQTWGADKTGSGLANAVAAVNATF